MRGLFEVEREDWDVMPRSSLLGLIHPSAWKVDSANFGLRLRSEAALPIRNLSRRVQGI
jgi:hypothetical protein